MERSLKALRWARGAAFDDRTGLKGPEDLAEETSHVGRGRSPGFPMDFPPLPVAESDVIVVGSIQSYQPYFSNDRTSIYHEFTVNLEVILTAKTSEVPAGREIAILGEGGSIRRKNGRVFTDFVPPSNENDIRVGGRYVLFLVYRPDGNYFQLLKAWQLRAGRAIPMALSDIEKSRQGKLPLAGMPEAGFLAELRNAIVHRQ